MPNTQQPVKILIIDDDEDDYFIICDYLRQIKDKIYQIDWCYNYKEAIDHLKLRKYNLYFVDYKLGANTGLDFLRTAIKIGNQDPIIFLTGKGTKEIDIQAMQEGATDYLIKSELTTEKLERSIRYALERAISLKALKENERKYRTIFETSKDAVFITDIRFNFKDVNEATASLFGRKKETLVGKNFFDFIASKKQQDEVLQHLFNNQLNDCEIELFNQEGEKRFCVISGELEKDHLEEQYIQCIVHDITTLKKAEKTNLQAEKLAATARLVQTLAHEVRNPLNNISLSVEQLLSDNMNEDNEPLLQIINRNSKRIEKLIKELLSSAKPSDIDFELIDLHKVIDETVLAAADRIALQQIRLITQYHYDPIFINADTAKIKIALLNIIINGIEAIEKDCGTITIETTTSGKNNILKIIDSGCGIPEENLPKLFEPYFTSKRNGMGLGLASTLNILQAHKATIEVQSLVNQGTTFSILFDKVRESELV